MNSPKFVQHDPDLITLELRQVLQTMAWLRENLSAVAAGVDGLKLATTARTKLAELRYHLAQLFAAEEEQGYAAEILAAAPELADKADRLLRQHAELLETAVGLWDSVENVPINETPWDEIEAKFREFSTQLAAHEAAEKALYHRAFCEDIGLLD